MCKESTLGCCYKTLSHGGRAGQPNDNKKLMPLSPFHQLYKRGKGSQFNFSDTFTVLSLLLQLVATIGRRYTGVVVIRCIRLPLALATVT